MRKRPIKSSSRLSRYFYQARLGKVGLFASFLLLISGRWVIPTLSQGGLSPQALKCEYRVNPLGIDKRQPRLSWELESNVRGDIQTAYRILVADDKKVLDQSLGNLWDSGKVESSRSLPIHYRGKDLISGLRCFWKVRVWDRNGRVSDWSQPAWWEMGLLDKDDWEGIWISDGKSNPKNEQDYYLDDPAPLFRREFAVEKPIRSARLYITGLGYYEARLNGKRVGDQYLDPGWTDYRDRVFYSVYDVTGHIQSGDNCLGVMLGNGWFNPLPLKMWGRLNLREHLPVGRPRFIAQLNILFADGTRISVATDEKWKTSGGPILRNNVYLGEEYDARREWTGWDLPGGDDPSWRSAAVAASPDGRIEAQYFPPIKILEIISPAAVSEPSPGVTIFDFGKNFSGWARLELEAPRGTRIKLRYGELLNQDGSLNGLTSVCGQIKGKDREGNNRGGPGSPEFAWQSDSYTAKGSGREIFEPHFSFHGFRYVEVTGWPGRPGLSSLKGIRLGSSVDAAGSFTCSHPLLNRIQEMVVRTFAANLFSVQSDCPHREKFGYGGDIGATSEAFMFNFDMAAFYAKTVRDFADAAMPDGLLTDTAPFVGIQYCGVAWAMVHPLLLNQLHQYYGDRSLLDEQYEVSKKWLNRVAENTPEHIVRDGLSDHEALESAPAPEMVTPLYYQSASLLARLAGIINRVREEERFVLLQENIRSAYLKNFLKTETGRFSPNSQAGQAFALYLGLAPSSERQAALDFLLEKITDEHKSHLSTGIFGTKFLLDVLSAHKRSDIAFKIVARRSFPGWGFMLENGATTLWEHWQFSDDTYSHNHPMFGSVSEWFFKWLAGIQPDPEAVGFNKITIRPQPVAGLDWVKASYHSIRGIIKSEWRRLSTGELQMNISIPPGTSAIVHIPASDLDSVTEGDKPLESAEGIHLLRQEKSSTLAAIVSGSYRFRVKSNNQR